MLVLVLNDHSVHEAVAQQRIVAVEIDRRERVEHTLAHTGDEGARLRGSQDRQ